MIGDDVYEARWRLRSIALTLSQTGEKAMAVDFERLARDILLVVNELEPR